MEVWRHLEREVDGVKLKRAVAALLHSPGSREHDRQQVISAVLSLLQGASLPPTLLMPKLEQLSHLVWERLNTGHWAEVWDGWRSTYGLLCAARALCTAHLVLGRGGGGGEVALQCSVHCALLREVVRLCDLGLLLGGPVMGGLLEGLAQYITECLSKTQQEGEEDRLQEQEVEEVPAKLPRRVEEPGRELGWKLSPLVAALAPLPRLPCPSLTTFLTSCLLPGRPHLLEHCMQDWPAMQPRTRWSKQRLLDLAGPRTVPVELGRVYTEDSWTQRLMTVEEFVKGHMEREGGWEQSGSAVGAGWAEPAGVVGYLAQHQLLYQVPRLRADIQVPDYCYTGESEDEPDTNVWIGPRGTVSPAHTDPKHNVLCQVVGTKYVALFLPSQNECMYPSEAAMMGNTSRLDLDNIDLEQFPKVAELRGYETLLRPGEMLYIPPKVWHYVRSLEESFSVSFWWQ